MARHVLTIDGWQPARVNALYSGHWARRARLKRGDRELVAWYARAAGIPPAEGKRRVSLTIVLGPRERAGDPDSFYKSTLDALVHAGLLTDDNRQGVELGPVTFARGPARRTEVVLEDLG